MLKVSYFDLLIGQCPSHIVHRVTSTICFKRLGKKYWDRSKIAKNGSGRKSKAMDAILKIYFVFLLNIKVN